MVLNNEKESWNKRRWYYDVIRKNGGLNFRGESVNKEDVVLKVLRIGVTNQMTMKDTFWD